MIRRHTLLEQGNFFIDGEFRLCDIRIVGSTIVDIDSELHPSKRDVVVPLDGLFVVPGLINCHDHLEFNLFPRLGNPPYRNYVEWSKNIQEKYKSEIREVLQVPLRLRLLWGAYKNILSGVTTVLHHNKYYFQFRTGYPVDVYKDYRWIHSLRLEKRDLSKLVTSDTKKSFIHLGEGTDALAKGELMELARLGGLSKNTVIIHGVGLQSSDVDAIEAAGAAVIWCPASNMYLFSQTAPVKSMLGRIPVLLGTDSTLTGSLSLFEELRFAQGLKKLSSKVLLNMVTEAPANLLGLNKGRIGVGWDADLLVYDTDKKDPLQAVVDLTPATVVCLFRKGTPVFGNVKFANIMKISPPSSEGLSLDGQEKFLIGNLPKLIEDTLSYSPHLALIQKYLPR